MLSRVTSSRLSWCTGATFRYFSSSKYPQLTVSLRSTGESGSRRSRLLRSENRIPGVIYGVDDDKNVLKRMFTIEKKVLERELRVRGRSFENTIYEVILEDITGTTSYVVVPRHTQFDPLSDAPLAVNFLRYRPGTQLRIPVDFMNTEQSQDIKRGSFVVSVQPYVDVVCEDVVPATLELDLSGAQKGDIYRIGSLTFPDKVRPAKKSSPDKVLAVIKTARAS